MTAHKVANAVSIVLRPYVDKLDAHENPEHEHARATIARILVEAPRGSIRKVVALVEYLKQAKRGGRP